MAELDHALRDVAGRIDWPETPDLATAVRRRLPERRRRISRPLVLALAVLAVAIAAAMAVPQARTSILRFFHLEGVTVERVDRLPATRPFSPLELGAPVSLHEARLRLGQPILLPDGDRPDAVFFDGALAGGGVNILYGPATRPRLLVSEFLTVNYDVIRKSVGLGSRVTEVLVGRDVGLWVPGKHAVRFGPLPPRLAGNSLIWRHGSLIIRLEGDLSKATAIDLAGRFQG